MSDHDEDEFYYPDEIQISEGRHNKEHVVSSANKENVSEFRDFIEEQWATNTKDKSKSDLNVWERFCTERNDTRKLEFIPWKELNILLCEFFKNIRKKNGAEYEPGTLTSFRQRSIQRYLNGQGSQANLIQGDEFKLSREVLGAKRKQFVVQHGKGNRPQASRKLSKAEEDKLFEEGEFDEQNPVVLQRTVRWLLALNFGFRARDESRRLQWGDVSLEKDPDTDNEMLVWKAERI